MEINCRNFNFKLDWKSIVGVCTAIGGFRLLNTLSKRGQLESLNLDLDNKKISLNT